MGWSFKTSIHINWTQVLSTMTNTPDTMAALTKTAAMLIGVSANLLREWRIDVFLMKFMFEGKFLDSPMPPHRS